MDEIVSKLSNRIMFDRGAFYFFLSLGTPQLLFLFGGIFLNLSIVEIGVLLDLVFLLYVIEGNIFEKREQGFALIMTMAVNVASLLLGVSLRALLMILGG